MLKTVLMITIVLVAGLQNPAPPRAPQANERRPPNQESQSTQQPTNAEQRGSEQSPFIIKLLPSEPAQRESRYNSADGLSNARDSWSLSDKIAVIASIVAFLQFAALLWTVLVMIFNGRRQLRAYVLPENATLSEGGILVPPQPAKTNIPGVTMLIKNGGQTPAYDVVSWAQISVIQVAQENVALVVPPLQQQFPHTLGGGCIFNKALWFDRQLTANEIADIATGTRAIYFYGRIQYRDAFKKLRYTNFRLRYSGQFPPPPTGVIFNFSEQGNDAN